MIGKRNNIRRCGSRDELNTRLENIIPLLKNHLLQPGLERRSLSGRDEILGGRLDAPPVAGLRRRHGPLGGSRRGAPNANWPRVSRNTMVPKKVVRNERAHKSSCFLGLISVIMMMLDY